MPHCTWHFTSIWASCSSWHSTWRTNGSNLNTTSPVAFSSAVIWKIHQNISITTVSAHCYCQKTPPKPQKELVCVWNMHKKWSKSVPSSQVWSIALEFSLLMMWISMILFAKLGLIKNYGKTDIKNSVSSFPAFPSYIQTNWHCKSSEGWWLFCFNQVKFEVCFFP